MKNHDKAIEQLKKSMDAEHDIREQCRDSDDFINKKDGQWDPEIYNKMSGRPRYTFDKINPAIDQIMGEIRQNDFTLKVSPADGAADKKTAQTFDGLIRNIVNISNAELIFDSASEQNIGIGCAGFEVVNDYYDSDSFDQDLLIKPLWDFHNRVWFDPNSKLPDRSDARWVMVLEEPTKDEYEKEFPEGSGMSISTDENTSSYYYKPESVTIGRLLYKKQERKTIVKMSDGSIYERDEEFEAVEDELAQLGVTVINERERKVDVVYQRYLDGKEWLDDEEETVFRLLPVIPMYANFRVSKGKVIYRSLTQFSMDAQRSYNYARSKQTEEVALSPKPKYWMTPDQAKGHTAKLSTLNTNADPVQLFNVDPNLPQGPLWLGGSQVNQGLAMVAADSKADINEGQGLFGASMGDNPNLQSGVAINTQIDRGNNGTIKYFSAIEAALNYLGKVLIDAIPRVYDATRTVRIIGDDGSSDMVELNKVVLDQQTGQLVTLNDMAAGKYDVTCDIGAAFKNRQDESSQMFADMVAAVPEVAQLGLDVWLANVNAVGFDKVAERARAIALQNGTIPFEQMTEEEQAQAQQAAQQPPEPSPDMLFAQAEMKKADAEMLNQQNNQAELQIKAMDMQAKYQGQTDKLQSETALNLANIEQGQQKLDLQVQQQQFSQMMEMQKAMLDELSAQAKALKDLKDATGADALINQNVAEAYDNIADDLADESSPNQGLLLFMKHKTTTIITSE